MTQCRDIVAEIVREFDAQGWHRTGTAVDRASAAWLAERVGALGASASFETFSLDRVDPRPSFVEIDGRRENGLPTFDATFTGPGGIAGQLGPLGSDAEIGLTGASPWPDEQRLFREERRASRHRAIVAFTAGGGPGLAPFNAEAFDAPFGPPVLQVASSAAPWLHEAAARRAVARVVADAARQSADAVNVTLTRAGREPDLAPVVVMTPRSGWWGCASERGGGIACWLEALRDMCATEPRRTVRFVASSGHELGHLGLRAFLEARPALVGEAFTWVHLGASLGARGGTVRPVAGDGRLLALAVGPLAALGQPIILHTPERPTHGESREIRVRGGRFVSLGSSNPRFHLATDRWPDAVDLDALAGLATATVALVRALSATGPAA